MINQTNHVRIKGIAAAVPETMYKTDDFIKQFGEKAIASFKKSSGVLERYIVTAAQEPRGGIAWWQTAGDLAYAAAKKLMEAHKIDPLEIGALVLVTQSPDYGEPCTACVLQHRLGLSNECIAFDVTLGCSGYSYGVNVGASLMETSRMKYALVLAADAKGGNLGGNFTMGTNAFTPQSSTNLLLGDAGTATLLERTDSECESLVFFSQTDGWGYKAVGFLNRGTRYPHVPAGTLFMDDIAVLNYITAKAPAMIQSYMDYMHTTPDDYDCFALHQASNFTLKQVARRIPCDMEKIPLSLTKYGNTGPASIPITLAYAYGDSEQHQNIHAMMCGFGVGLSISAFSAHIPTDGVLPVFTTDERFDDGFFDQK